MFNLSLYILYVDYVYVSMRRPKPTTTTQKEIDVMCLDSGREILFMHICVLLGPLNLI